MTPSVNYLTVGPIPENGTFTYTGQLTKADGKTPIPALALRTFTFTIVDVVTGVVINNRVQGTNGLNANGFTIDVSGSTGNLSWTPLPADNPIVSKNPNSIDGYQELHEAVFTWTWLDNNLQPLQQQRKVMIAVEKYAPTETPIQAGAGNDPVTFNFGLGAVGIQVWVSTDDRGINRVGGTLLTDENGRVLYMLTNGAQYYLWTSSPNYEPILGQAFTAVVDS